MREKKLTPKQQKFINEYLVDGNATQSAIRAGYSKKTAQQTGSENLLKPVISTAIIKALQEQEQRTEITADWTLKEIHRIASFDPRKLYDENGNFKEIKDLDDDTAAAIGGIDVVHRNYGKDDDKTEETTKKLKIWDKNSALEKLAKHFKLLIDRVESSGPDGGPIKTQTELSPEAQKLLQEIAKHASTCT